MFLNFLIERMAPSINFEIKDNDNNAGSVEGIVYHNRSQLLNWLESEGADRNSMQAIENIQDNDLLPVAILKNIHVNDEYKNKGLGNKGMSEFLDAVKESSSIILVADVGEMQGEGFNLIDWYKKFGFNVIGNSTISDYPIMMLVQ